MEGSNGGIKYKLRLRPWLAGVKSISTAYRQWKRALRHPQ